MSTTVVSVSGKGSNPKTILYVGGLEESVTESVLKAAFIPFGEIKECNIPLDNEKGKHRGFGFVEYEEREDAADAIDNMHNSELYGRCGPFDVGYTCKGKPIVLTPTVKHLPFVQGIAGELRCPHEDQGWG